MKTSQRRTLRLKSLVLLLTCLFALSLPIRGVTAQVPDGEANTNGAANPILASPPKKSNDPIRVGPKFTGKISLPDGSPAIGANVYLLRIPNGSYTLPTKPLKTQADFDGAYSFDSLEPGRYKLWAETPECTSLTKKLGGQRITVQERPRDAASDVPLALHKGCGFDIAVVRRGSGEPVAGAKVSFGWTDIAREYETKEDGFARIRALAKDDWYVIVKADGLETQFKKTSEQELGFVLPMRFELGPGGELSGVVRDGSGEPIPEARVTVGRGDVSMAPRYDAVSSDDKGRYSVKGLPLGVPLRVYASKKGYESGRLELAVATAEAAAVGDLTMKKPTYGGDVIVNVVDQKDRPVVDATLFNHGRSSSDLKSSRTDERGEGRLEDLQRTYAGYHVIVKADGFIPQRISITPSATEQPVEITVKLELGKTVDGIVVRPDGTPAPNLSVYFNGGEYGGNELGGRVKTDSKGRFQLTGLPDSSTVTVYTPREFAPISRLRVPTESDEEFRITMTVAGALRVRAIDSETGKPIREFNVKIGFPDVRKPEDPRLSGISSSLIDQGINIQGTKKEYLLSGQPIGAAFKVIVSAKGYEPSTVPRVQCQAANLAPLLDVALAPQRAEDYQTVAGRLLGADGKPISGASVRLLVGSAIPNPSAGRLRTWRFYHWGLLHRDDIENRDKCVQLLKTASDPQGRFRFEGVKKGMPWMELFYFGNGVLSQRFSNLAERNEVDLGQLEFRSERPAKLVVGIDRDKYPEADSVELSAANYTNGPNALKLAFDSETEKIGESDEIVFENLPSGEYVVGLRKTPERSGENSFMIRSITQLNVTIQEGKSAKIEF